MRLLAVGDIHGHLDKLTRLIDIVVPTEGDKVVFLGDYIDRGPNTPGVIEYLIKFKAKYPKTIFLAGNHEHLLFGALQSAGILPVPSKKSGYKRIGEVPSFEQNPGLAFVSNGGRITLDQYGGDLLDIPRSHIEFVADCLLYHEEHCRATNYLFVHAGVSPNVPMNKQDPVKLLWSRDCHSKKEEMDHMEGRIIVHGHTPGEVPGNHPHKINVDSGVYQNAEGRGKLTCCDVITRKIWQA